MTAIDWEARWAMGGWREDAELRRKRFPIGPRNTASNVAYLLAAVYLVATGAGATRWVIAAGMVALAIGSAGYHAYKVQKPWNNADWFGMAATMVPLSVHGLLHSSPGLPLGAFSIGLVAASLISMGKHSDEIMGLLFLGAALPPFLAGNRGPVLIAVALFALAMAFWLADRKKVALVGLWGHALWHVGTAVAMPQLHRAQG